MRKFLYPIAALLFCALPLCAQQQGQFGGAGGGGGAPSGPAGGGVAPIVGWYFGPNCQNNATGQSGQCYYTTANVQIDNTATWSSSSTTITITDGKFSSADVTTPAKYLWGFGGAVSGHSGCNPYASMTGITVLTTAHLTITGFIDSNHVTVSANPGTTFASANQGCIVWGNTDDSGASALETAYDSALSCPRITLAAGNYIFTTPHFNSQPAACASINALYGSSAPASGVGNIWYAGGEQLEGRGVGATQIMIPPDFPESGSCNNGFTFLSSAITYNGACFAVPPEAIWHDFTVGYSGPNGLPTNVAMFNVGVGSLEHVNCLLAGGGVAGTEGIVLSAQAQLQQVNLSACGATGVYADKSTGPGGGGSSVPYNFAAAVAFRLSVDNSASSVTQASNVQLQANSAFYCHSCRTFGTQDATGVGIAEWTNRGGWLWLDDVNMFQQNSSLAVTAYQATVAGSLLYASDVHFGTVTTSGIPPTVNALQCSAACTNYLFDSELHTVSTGNSYSDGSASSVLHDLGGNTITGSGTAPVVTGQVFNESLSANATLVTAAKLVLSAGWGSTAAVTALAGANAPIQFTITNSGTGQGASPTITYTFPTPYFVSPISCTATDLSGTNPIGTFTSSALSKTGVTFTFSLTPTVSDTENMSVTCVTP